MIYFILIYIDIQSSICIKYILIIYINKHFTWIDSIGVQIFWSLYWQQNSFLQSLFEWHSSWSKLKDFSLDSPDCVSLQISSKFLLKWLSEFAELPTLSYLDSLLNLDLSLKLFLILKFKSRSLCSAFLLNKFPCSFKNFCDIRTFLDLTASLEHFGMSFDDCFFSSYTDQIYIKIY